MSVNDPRTSPFSFSVSSQAFANFFQVVDKIHGNGRLSQKEIAASINSFSGLSLEEQQFLSILFLEPRNGNEPTFSQRIAARDGKQGITLDELKQVAALSGDADTLDISDLRTLKYGQDGPTPADKPQGPAGAGLSAVA